MLSVGSVQKSFRSSWSPWASGSPHGRRPVTCLCGWCQRCGHACAFGSWRHPGDEYGLLGVSMLISIWLVILIHSNNLSQAILPLIAAGAVPMAVFGFLLDRLPVSRRLWAAVYIVASVALFAWGLSSFPSLEKAIAKNGSISAYAFCSANLGMYVSVLTCLGGGAVVWAWRRFRRQNEI